MQGHSLINHIIAFVLFSSHRAQRTGRGGRVKLHAGLLKNPGFDSLVVDAQQVERPADVVLFAHAQPAPHLRHAGTAHQGHGHPHPQQADGQQRRND